MICFPPAMKAILIVCKYTESSVAASPPLPPKYSDGKVHTDIVVQLIWAFTAKAHKMVDSLTKLHMEAIAEIDFKWV